jgi:RraA family protein
VTIGDAGSTDAQTLEAFRGAATSIISDCLGRVPGLVGLRPFHGRGTLLGTALTVRTHPGDNLVVHQALERIRPGDVLVVDGGGDISRALVGEIMKSVAQSRGCAGFVIDGAIRDVRAFGDSSFPCYARGAVPRGPFKHGPGEIGIPVVAGGCIVNPGDVVVGDDDGVVTFSPSLAVALLERVRAEEAREADVLERIRAGRYDGGYGRSA